MLVRRRHDLVARLEIEPRENDVAAVRRRHRERDLIRLGGDECCDLRAQLPTQREHPLEVRTVDPPALEVVGQRCGDRLHHPARERPERAGVEVRHALEDGEHGTGLVERQPILSSTGA